MDKAAVAKADGVFSTGLFTVKTAQQWCEEAALRPMPRPLWWSLWYEGEVCCLFADTNMGKSIYAVQIGDYVALHSGMKVAYFDFELSDKQFQLRYTDPQTGEMYRFADGFYRVEMSAESSFVDSVPLVMSHIERCVDAIGAKVVIIDNISWVCNRSESGDAAGELMQELISLKKRRVLSVLVLAHTPKRSECSQLTQNSLAGSKRLANFMDSMIAIGRIQGEPQGRYIKQIKVRSSELEYGEDSVITSAIERSGAALSFNHLSFARELDLITPKSVGGDDEALSRQVAELMAKGLSQSQIAEQLRVGKLKVNKICRMLKSDAAAGE